MNRKTFLNIALTASLLVPSAGFAMSQDVAVDRNNSRVYSTSGDCVRTKWEAAGDVCANAPQPSVNDRRKSGGMVSRSYMAFFDFNSANLSSTAKGIIAKAVDSANNDSSFIVTGHADRSGSDSYNVSLSKRRADAVKAELRRLGVNGSKISTQAKGEATPLVSTKDGVREPQNRRVEIVFTK